MRKFRLTMPMVLGLLLVATICQAAMNPSQLTTLRAEIDVDPKTLGYSGKDEQEVADLLNEVGLSNETVDVTYSGVTIQVDDLLDCYIVSEYNDITAGQKILIDFYVDLSAKTNGLYLNKFLPKLRLLINQKLIVPGNIPETAQRFQDLTYRAATRAEALGLPVVTDMDVAIARDLQ